MTILIFNFQTLFSMSFLIHPKKQDLRKEKGEREETHRK